MVLPTFRTPLRNTDSNTGYGGCWAGTRGEVQNTANQMPGGVNNHDYMTVIQARDTTGVGGWYTPTFNSASTVSWAKNSNPASGEVDIWDSACSS